jgi:hypothetical protein
MSPSTTTLVPGMPPPGVRGGKGKGRGRGTGTGARAQPPAAACGARGENAASAA